MINIECDLKVHCCCIYLPRSGGGQIGDHETVVCPPELAVRHSPASLVRVKVVSPASSPVIARVGVAELHLDPGAVE